MIGHEIGDGIICDDPACAPEALLVACVLSSSCMLVVDSATPGDLNVNSVVFLRNVKLRLCLVFITSVI